LVPLNSSNKLEELTAVEIEVFFVDEVEVEESDCSSGGDVEVKETGNIVS